MAANKNNETESKDIKKPFLQRKKLRGSKYLRKTIDLPVEKVNIMRISRLRASVYKTGINSHRPLAEFAFRAYNDEGTKRTFSLGKQARE